MKTKEIYMYILGAMIILGIFTITTFFLYKEMPPANKDIMLMLVGAMLAKFSDIVAYFFGSSKGSSEKDALLYNSTPTAPPNTPGTTTESKIEKTVTTETPKGPEIIQP